jgi:hypothetical protein
VDMTPRLITSILSLFMSRELEENSLWLSSSPLYAYSNEPFKKMFVIAYCDYYLAKQVSDYQHPDFFILKTECVPQATRTPLNPDRVQNPVTDSPLVVKVGVRLPLI